MIWGFRLLHPRELCFRRTICIISPVFSSGSRIPLVHIADCANTVKVLTDTLLKSPDDVSDFYGANRYVVATDGALDSIRDTVDAITKEIMVGHGQVQDSKKKVGQKKEELYGNPLHTEKKFRFCILVATSASGLAVKAQA